MADELSQEEINRLLSSAGPTEGKSQSLLKKFQESGRKFTKEIVEVLVWELLADEEKGHGLWWGGESCLSYRNLLSFESKELKNGGYEVSAVCEMEYESAHTLYYEGYEPILQNSHIKLKLGQDLTIEEFEFK
jgi:hypothetical protein